MRRLTSLLVAFACVLLALACSSGAPPAPSAGSPAGNGTFSLPPGDLRDPGLTAAEEARAEEAYRLFEAFQPTREFYYRDEVFDPNDPEQAAFFEERLREVAAKYEDRTSLASDEEAEVTAALSPYIVYLAMLEAKESNALVIPAGAKLTFDLPAYCLDSQRPTPKPGEPFQLVPATSLIPASLAPIYEGILQRAAEEGAGHDEVRQALLWKIRNSALTGRQIDLAQLGEPARALVQDSTPDYAAVLARYNASAPRPAVDPPEAPSWGSYLTGVVADLGQQAYRISGLERQVEAIEQSFDQWGRLGRSTAAMIPGVRQQLAALDRMSVEEPLPDPVSGYSLLAPGMAVHATSPDGGAANVTVEVANTTSIPAVFSPDSCIGQPSRNIQRIALQNISTYRHSLSSVPAHAEWTAFAYSYDITSPYIWPLRPTYVVAPAIAIGIDEILIALGIIGGSSHLAVPWDSSLSSMLLKCLQNQLNYNDDIPRYLYHYTFPGYYQSIIFEGIIPNHGLVFTTPNGSLSPEIAEQLLALPPAGRLRTSLLQIDTAQLAQLGIYPTRRNVVEPRWNRSGGGEEIIFEQRLPAINPTNGKPIIIQMR